MTLLGVSVFDRLHNQIVKNAASILRIPSKCLPEFVQRKLLLEGLNQAFYDSLDDGDFEFLTDKWLKIEIKDLQLSWCISYSDEKLVVADKPVEHDVSFTGNLNDLVLISGRKEDPDTLFFQRRLQIEGDTELGLEVKNLMDSIDFDRLPNSIKFLINELAEFVLKGMRPLNPQLQYAK